MFQLKTKAFFNTSRTDYLKQAKSQFPYFCIPKKQVGFSALTQTFFRIAYMETNNLGLYEAANEHDACGVGMVVNIHGNKSHELVDSALKVLENMRHRGAEGADNKTGDGAGIMLQIPHEFILLQGIPVPEKGKYGTGLVFLPKHY